LSARSPCSPIPWSSARARGYSPTPARTLRLNWSTRSPLPAGWRSRSTGPRGARSTQP